MDDGGFKLAAGLTGLWGCFWSLLVLAFWIGVGFVAWHFIAKYW